MPIEEGKKAPAFTLEDQNGKKISLKDFAGRTLVVYFYPKDDTPGCTKEAQGFRKELAAFEKLGASVVGVSPDGPTSHQKFIDKHKLNFALLCDPSHKVMEQYGAWGEKVLYGKKTLGVIRSTVLIGPDGKVLKHWKRVASAADHPHQVLDFLKSL
jgi:peroxiredoxin Q/BCP